MVVHEQRIDVVFLAVRPEVLSIDLPWLLIRSKAMGRQVRNLRTRLFRRTRFWASRGDRPMASALRLEGVCVYFMLQVDFRNRS